MAKFVFDEKTGTLVQQNQQKAIGQEMPQPVIDKGETMSVIDRSAIQKPNVKLNEGVLQFREKSDLTVFQIVDEQTGKVMAYISGYALDINFNLGELKSVERVEQMIDGIGKMFRKIVLDKIMQRK